MWFFCWLQIRETSGDRYTEVECALLEQKHSQKTGLSWSGRGVFVRRAVVRACSWWVLLLFCSYDYLALSTNGGFGAHCHIAHFSCPIQDTFPRHLFSKEQASASASSTIPLVPRCFRAVVTQTILQMADFMCWAGKKKYLECFLLIWRQSGEVVWAVWDACLYHCCNFLLLEPNHTKSRGVFLQQGFYVKNWSNEVQTSAESKAGHSIPLPVFALAHPAL